jgi:hypothetical protein
MSESQRKSHQAPTANIPPFGLRLQSILKSELEHAATDAGRSLNAEICDRLRQSFEPMVEMEPDTLEAVQRFAGQRGISEAQALTVLVRAGLRDGGAKVVSLNIAPGVSMKELGQQMQDALAEHPDAPVYPTVGAVIGQMRGGVLRIKQTIKP